MAEASFRSADIRLELTIRAPRSAVWRSLTEGIGEWWPAKFYVGKAPKRFAVESHIGGRVFEDRGDGEGALYATVTVFEDEAMIQFAGDLSADFGDLERGIRPDRPASLEIS